MLQHGEYSSSIAKNCSIGVNRILNATNAMPHRCAEAAPCGVRGGGGVAAGALAAAGVVPAADTALHGHAGR